MQTQTKRLAGLAVLIASLATSGTATAAAAEPPAKGLKVARAVVRATDRTPIVETHDGAVIAGHAVYASYSDRRSRIAATYLEGKLVQGTVDTTLYAANGSCFRRERLHEFVGLSQLAKTLLPLPTKAQHVSYTLTGRTLHWREAATRQHGAEHGTVEFNGHDRITSSSTAPYTSGHRRTEGETITVTYPARLPRSVPAEPPKPACKTS